MQIFKQIFEKVINISKIWWIFRKFLRKRNCSVRKLLIFLKKELFFNAFTHFYSLNLVTIRRLPPPDPSAGRGVLAFKWPRRSPPPPKISWRRLWEVRKNITSPKCIMKHRARVDPSTMLELDVQCFEKWMVSGLT